MIRIIKPAQVPEKLAIDGKTETEKNKQLYIQFEEEYKTGQRKFDFNSSVYGHETVKKTLKTAQYHKCCFCEKKEESGDIEHFRPKAGYQQNEKDKISTLGYYWLAYEWDNLFYCCPKCNRSFKRNLFPLADNSKRAKSHLDNIDDEEPLFIHPEKENPEEFIEYIREKPRAINGNERGKVTIQKTGIDRPLLDEWRLAVYKAYKLLYELLKSKNTDKSMKKQIRNSFNEAVRDSAEYASMIRCAVRDKFRY